MKGSLFVKGLLLPGNNYPCHNENPPNTKFITSSAVNPLPLFFFPKLMFSEFSTMPAIQKHMRSKLVSLVFTITSGRRVNGGKNEKRTATQVIVHMFRLSLVFVLSHFLDVLNSKTHTRIWWNCLFFVVNV